MVCVSSANSMTVSTFIRESRETNPTKIHSSNSMKILGFYFSSKPSVELHIATLQKKFRQRLWLLRNLKHAKADKKDLLDSYLCFIRPVADYCTNVYHTMMTGGMTDALEKLQTTALRIIYGFDKTREELLDKAGITTLQERRQ